MCASTSPQPCTTPAVPSTAMMLFVLCTLSWAPYRHGCSSGRTRRRDGCLIPSVWLMLRFSLSSSAATVCSQFLFWFLFSLQVCMSSSVHPSTSTVHQSSETNQSASSQLLQTKHGFHFISGMDHYSLLKWKRLSPSTLFVHALGLLWRCSDDAGCAGVINGKPTMTFTFLLFVTRLFKRLWREIWCPEWPDG